MITLSTDCASNVIIDTHVTDKRKRITQAFHAIYRPSREERSVTRPKENLLQKQVVVNYVKHVIKSVQSRLSGGYHTKFLRKFFSVIYKPDQNWKNILVLVSKENIFAKRKL